MEKLDAFVNENGGDTNIARLIGVRPRTVKAWRLGERVPRPERVRQMIDLSGGDLTWTDFYRDIEAA